MKICVLIVDDHPVFLQGLRRILEAESDIDVIGAARDVLVEGAQTSLPIK